MVSFSLYILAVIASVYALTQFREAYPDRTILWTIPALFAVYFAIISAVAVLARLAEEEDD